MFEARVRPVSDAASVACYRCGNMSDTKIREIQNILTEVDEILRARLAAAGLDVGHVVLAMAPSGAGVVRSNVGPVELGDMAELLAEVADGSAIERPENERLN